VRTSSNPAFRNLPGGQGGYAGFGAQGGGPVGGDAGFGTRSSGGSGPVGAGPVGGPPGAADSAVRGAEAGQRPLTVDDVVTKTAITAAAAIVAGVLTAISGLYVLVLPAFIVGLVLSLIVIFKQSSNPALIIAYSVAEGIALGGITGVFNTVYPGIGIQAVIGTAGVFIGMLVVYKTGAVRVTPRFQRWLMGALVGVLVLVLLRFVTGVFFGDALGMNSGGFLSIVISLVIIGVAAFSLLLDFDQADRAVREGLPARFAWYIAFGLMTTLVWLYIEILRLLSYFRE
jgi:uncharacterized YccA/Bax inhibitor family protein